MDREKIREFMDKFIGMAAGATTLGLLAVADRSGLSEYLGEHPNGTAEDIAEGARLELRYVQEIMAGLAAAGVVEYSAEDGVFTLPPEHALFLASELSPYFIGGWLDLVPSVMGQTDAVAAATVHGGGVAFDEFSGIVQGIDRLNGPAQRVMLTRKWLPAVPGLVEKMEAGIRGADVGCGAGTAAIIMAQSYPESEFVGYDISADSVDLANARSEQIPNVEFFQYSAEEIPVEPAFDLITTFDVIHDLVDPLAGMQRIREALTPQGSYLMMEPNTSSMLEENLNEIGALNYGISALHCMTQSLAHGGAGLGAAWGGEAAKELALEAGFGSFQPLDDIANDFSAFYVLTH